MTDEHAVTAIKEPHKVGRETITRWRGRCSCGRTTYMHYSTPIAATTALNRTHIAELNLNKGVNA